MVKGASVLAEREKLAGVCKEAGVRLAFLFGSAAAEPEASAGRDIDVAVLFERYSFAGYLALKERLSEVLGIGEDDLDLVVLNRANPALTVEVALEGLPLFVEDPHELDRFATDALAGYEDYRRFEREYSEELSKRLEEGMSMAKRKMDRERVEGYLSRMDEAVGRLASLRQRFSSVEEFERDLDTRELCVHHLRIALESVLDICRHFLAVNGVDLAEIDTTNLIELAGERGLLDPEFAQRIRGMAGMRNAIVHVYWRLDYQAIYDTVTGRLEEFDEFGREVRVDERRCRNGSRGEN